MLLFARTRCIFLPFVRSACDVRVSRPPTDRKTLSPSPLRNTPPRRGRAFFISTPCADFPSLVFRQTKGTRFALFCALIFLSTRIFTITDLIGNRIFLPRSRTWIFRFLIRIFARSGGSERNKRFLSIFCVLMIDIFSHI